jgi:protein phosphatase 1 regulatory subunit 7
MPSEKEKTPPPHISIKGDDVEGHDTPKSARSSSGWDGKLRVEKKLELVNPDALSDPEYSDEENVIPGEAIDADEGKLILILSHLTEYRDVGSSYRTYLTSS